LSLYSSIDRRINADAWFRSLSESGQWLWLRLLTGSHVTSVPGLWAATEEGLARAFGVSLEGFRERFSEVSRDPSSKGLARVIADWEAGVIWLPNALDFPCNEPKNPNALKSWKNHLELMPECDLKDQALRHFAEWVNARRSRFKKGWPYGSLNGSRKGSGNHDRVLPPQEQEQKQEQEQELQEGGGGAVLPFPMLVLEPRNLGEALRLTPRQRAQYAIDHTDIASYLTPQRWPEVQTTHAAVVSALKLPERPLQDWGRDRGLQALVALLAVAEPDYIIHGAAALVSDPWWKSRRRGLSDLTAEVLSRALGDEPVPTEAQSASRLKVSPRQPLAHDHTNQSEHLGTIGANEI
jgi:hypothetical protein